MSHVVKFDVTVLGCGSATPTMRHAPTAQVVNHNEQLYLLDCGEGTQLQLRKYKVKFQRINHIFITHLHGDHFLGLPGLLSTMHLLGRSRDLHVYAHRDLQKGILIQLEISHAKLKYNIVWHELNFKERTTLFESDQILIESFPLSHGIPCCGYRISEKPKSLNMRPTVIGKYGIPIARIRQIKHGADYVLANGDVVPNSELTLPPSDTRSYAYCTDTAYHKRTAEFVQGADLLYHESTFLESEATRAKDTHHSTAKIAAQVAKEAGVGRLMLGHYSARYRNDDAFIEEAKPIFSDTFLGDEGLKVSV